MLAGRTGVGQPVVEASPTRTSAGTGLSRGARGRCDSARGAARAGGERRSGGHVGRRRAGVAARGRGRAYDPAVVDAFEGVGADVLSELDGADEWEAALATSLARSPPSRPPSTRSAAAFADFTDLKSPWIRGHSTQGRLARGGQAACPGSTTPSAMICSAPASFTDLGRVAVEGRIWDKAGPLTTTPSGSECGCARTTRSGSSTGAARLRPRRASSLAPRARRRVGYHRSLPGEVLSWGARILAAADVFAALTLDGRTAPPTGRRKLLACSRVGGRPRR